MSIGEAGAIESIRMPKPKLDALLRRVEEERPSPPASGQRRLNGARGVVSVSQMGSETVYSVPMREIHNGGMLFLHRSMLHPKTPCVLHLTLPDGERIDIGGKVRDCRHVEGLIHDIGVEFDSPIDLGSLLAA